MFYFPILLLSLSGYEGQNRDKTQRAPDKECQNVFVELKLFLFLSFF